MPPTRSRRLRDAPSPFNGPGGKSMFSRASGFTINGGTFNISASQPLDPPSLPNHLSRYVEHLEGRLTELEDLVDMGRLIWLSFCSYGSISQINLSMESNASSQPAYDGAPQLVCEGRKDAMDHIGLMPANFSQAIVVVVVSPSAKVASTHAPPRRLCQLLLTVPVNCHIFRSGPWLTIQGAATAVRDACPICRSSFAERVQTQDTVVSLDGSGSSHISIGPIQS
ncbi:hypothetical protein DFH09DRAFT_1111300 [Mycena vulgaris]|nr:hypothetical protein DFH09DRAFT_1111300 [Mycena vulgaris]